MSINKVEIQDDQGNVYHPHTTADVVFMADGTTVEKTIANKAPTNHTHDGIYHKANAGTFTGDAQLDTIFDENTYNLISGRELWQIQVSNSSFNGSISVTQTKTLTYSDTRTAGTVFKRTYYSVGGWSAWTMIYDTSNVTTATTVPTAFVGEGNIVQVF